MARDPNERRSSSIIEAAGDVPAGAVLPPEVKSAGIGTGNGQYYGYRVIYANGRSEIEWYKRGSGGGGDAPDPVEIRSEAPTAIDIKDAWDKGEEKEQAAASKPPEERNNNGRRERWNPTTQKWEDVGVAVNATAPTATGTKEWRTEGRPDGQGGYDNSRPIMAAYVNGQRTGETREPTGAELKDWNEAGQRQRNPGGRLDSEIKADADKAAATAKADKEKADADARANQPKDGRESIRGKDGKPYVKVTKVNPQTGKSEVYYENEAGQRVPPPEDTVSSAEPAGAPRPNTNYGQAAAGLTQYRDFLNTQVELNRTSGGRQGITPQQADKLMETRLAQVKLTMEEQQGVVGTQTQMYGQQVQQRGQTLTDTAGRRTAAGNNYSTVLSNFMPLLKYMPKGGGEAFMRLLTGAVNYGQDQTAAWGGFRESPEIQYGPAAQAANRAPMPGQTSSSGTMAPYAPPAPAPAAAPPGVPPPNAAEVEAARQATMATNQAALGAGAAPVPPVGAPVAPAPVPVMANPNTGQTGDPMTQAPAINPATGEPTGLAPLPENGQFAPAPLFNAKPPEQQTLPLLPPQPGSPAGGNVQMMPTAAPSFLNAYSQPPRPRSLDLLINDPDIPNEIVAEAYRRVYGRTPSLVG